MSFRRLLFPSLVVLASAAAWAVIFAAVPYSEQDFPLADDWAYARGAIAFAHGQGLHYFSWSPMPQLAQWLWAAPFLWLSGNSLAALRLAMILVSWPGLWAFYELLRQEEFSEAKAALGAATLALHPLFFLIQGSFMTDVPSLSLCLVALAFYGRAFRGGRAGWLAAAAGAAVLAAVNRQNTVAAPAAAALVLLGRRDLRWRPGWLVAVLVPMVVAVAVHQWFNARTDVVHSSPGLPPEAWSPALPFVIVLHCGLAALPMLLLQPRPRSRKSGGIGLAALVLMLGSAYYWHEFVLNSQRMAQDPSVPEQERRQILERRQQWLPRGGLFPYIDGHIGWWGAYSEWTLVGGDTRPVILTEPVRWTLSLLGCVAGAGLIMRLIENGGNGRLWGLLPLFTLVSIPLIYVSPSIFDRRLLFLFPGVLYVAGLAPRGPRLLWVPSLGALALFAAAALGITHDSLAWNAARWKLGRRAVAEGKDAWEIEGGFEWDGWYSPEEIVPPVPGRKYLLGFTRQRFAHVNARYALSFYPFPGVRVLDHEPYFQWLRPGRYAFYLIELPDQQSGQTKEMSR